MFDPNACRRYLNKSLQHCHVVIETEKKMADNERVLQTDHGTFMPSVFSIYRSMGRKCHEFYCRLSDLLLEKLNLPKSVVANWVGSKVCFALLKSSFLCLCGSRTVCKKIPYLECDADISHDLAKIYNFLHLKQNNQRKKEKKCMYIY